MAARMATLERDADRAERKRAVIAGRLAEVAELDPALRDTMPTPEDLLARLDAGGSRSDRLTLIIELAFTDPFTPYELRWTRWHFEVALKEVARFALALRSTPAAIDTVLRAYAGLRGENDTLFAADLRAGAGREQRLADHPRFEAMSFLAHFVACVANAGKVAWLGYGGLNEAQWRAFLTTGIGVVRTQLTPPPEVIADRARANLVALADGWPPLDLASVSAAS